MLLGYHRMSRRIGCSDVAEMGKLVLVAVELVGRGIVMDTRRTLYSVDRSIDRSMDRSFVLCTFGRWTYPTQNHPPQNNELFLVTYCTCRVVFWVLPIQEIAVVP